MTDPNSDSPTPDSLTAEAAGPDPAATEASVTEATENAEASGRLAQPYSFEGVTPSEDVRARWGDLEPGTETGETITVAGRLMLRRIQGKLGFGTLADGTGRVQLFAPKASTPDFDAFAGLSLGDWIGVTGEVMTTRRGELSVKVDDWVRLAEARRPFPDKWHGLTDTDTRYRQRYVDLWTTGEARSALVLRSRAVSLIRRFFEDRNYLEVETPMLHSQPGGALATPFETHHEALDLPLYLRIAPELYLKRLVVGGMERVFEIGRVFRNEGISTRHNPEFTMLESYEAYGDSDTYMELTEQLVAHLAAELLGTTTVQSGEHELNLAPPWRRAPMDELTSEAVGETIGVDTPIERLRQLCDTHDAHYDDGDGPGKLLLELYEKLIEHTLIQPTFVTDYPVEVSPLSRAHRDRPGYVERFECIVAGRELCNGFAELTDPDEQLARFTEQAEARAAGDPEAMTVDEDYVRALQYGLPPTVGLGIGIDRLIMLLTNSLSIRDVVLFPTLRPEPSIDLTIRRDTPEAPAPPE